MKIIHYLSDIAFLKADLPLSLRTEMEQEFFRRYELLNHKDTYLLNFCLPLVQALFVLEKGDDVLTEFNEPFVLKYVEALKAGEVNYYRCTLHKGHSFQLYYSIVNTHDLATEAWLREQAE